MKSLPKLSGRWTAIRRKRNGLTAAATSSEKDAEDLLETLPTLLQCKLFRGNVSRLIFLCLMCWGSAVLGIALKKIFGENSYEQSVWVCVWVNEWKMSDAPFDWNACEIRSFLNKKACTCCSQSGRLGFVGHVTVKPGGSWYFQCKTTDSKDREPEAIRTFLCCICLNLRKKWILWAGLKNWGVGL